MLSPDFVKQIRTHIKFCLHLEHAAGVTAAIKASEPSSEPSVWASMWDITCERFRNIIDALPGGRNRAVSLDDGSKVGGEPLL